MPGAHSTRAQRAHDTKHSTQGTRHGKQQTAKKTAHTSPWSAQRTAHRPQRTPHHIKPPSAHTPCLLDTQPARPSPRYVGETDNLARRWERHRQLKRPSALYAWSVDGGKSAARRLETRLIDRLVARGVLISNLADGAHYAFGSGVDEEDEE